jgi:hypothetical protein
VRALCRRAGARLVVDAYRPASYAMATGALMLPPAALRVCPNRPSAGFVAAICSDEADLRKAASIGADLAVLDRGDQVTGKVASSAGATGSSRAGRPSAQPGGALTLPEPAIPAMLATDCHTELASCIGQAWRAGAHGIALDLRFWQHER